MRRLLWKRDAAESAIVEALEVCGWQVFRVNGDPGSPDLVAKKGETLIAGEVKSGKAKLRHTQGVFPVWRTVADAMEAAYKARYK